MTHTAKHTPGPWVAIKGDTFNPERPWGVSKYLSREAHIEIDGDDKEYPCRTEVIAELTETENPQEVEHTAYLIAAAPAMYEALKDLIGDLGDLHGGSIAELQCHWCGRDYEDEEAGGLCTSDDCPGYIARQAIAQAEGRHP